MKATTILLILGIAQVTLAGKWPKCKDQPDLSDYYASIFEQNAANSVVKRGTTWTFSCLHAALIKDENNDSMFSIQIYECCGKCEFPAFSLCGLAGYPDWLCGSEAYDCVFGCRDEDSVLEAVVEASDLGLNRKRELNITDTEITRVRKRLRLLRREKKCYEKECTIKNGVRDCCLKNTCFSIKTLTTKLAKKKKIRAKQLKKLAKAAKNSSTTTAPSTK